MIIHDPLIPGMLPAELIPVHEPDNPAELAIILGILDEHAIPYYVHNSGFGSLFPGPAIEFFNSQTIMVPSVAVDAARELIDDFLAMQAQAVRDDTP